MTAAETTDRAPTLGAPAHAGWWSYRSRAAALFGVAGLAITQPTLDVFGRNPTFFVAGRYPSSQIILFAVVIALVPGVVASAAVGLATRANRRVGSVVYAGALAGLAGLFGLSLMRTIGIDGLVLSVLIALASGGIVALLDRRVRAARQFLAYLALGNLAFVAVFAFASPTADLVAGGSTIEGWGTVESPPVPGPVVVVVLDEFPLTSLLRPDGTIDETRFPRFAELAQSSTWFRNASSESAATHISVPTILSGVRSAPDDLPTYQDHPRNLMTLFGDRYPVHDYQTLTDMCSPRACDALPNGQLSQALEDAAVAYGHKVLPGSLRDRLPEVDQSWGGFADGDGGPSAASPDPQTLEEYVAANIDDWSQQDHGPVAGLRQVAAAIGPEPSINFMHLLLPHNPWALTPWGTRLTRELYPRDVPDDPNDPNYEFLYRQLYQAHSLQVGAADSLLGELVDRLKSEGAWDDALVVVVSDHGIDMTAPGVGRDITEETQDEVLRIPLFVKAPGQAAGEVRDEPATTVDVLPSIIDLLDVQVDADMEGHSLFDGSEPVTDRLLTSDFDSALAVVARRAAQVPDGEGWVGLAAVGDNGDLVGRAVTDLDLGEPSALSWSLDERDALADVSTTAGPIPLSLGGVVHGASQRPPELLVAVNGTLAGPIGGYTPTGDGWRFSGLMAPFLTDGSNDVVAYEVERAGERAVLHPVDGG